MTWIPEAKKWYWMVSEWAFIGAGALQGAWLYLDDAQRALVPDNLVNWLTGAVVVLGFVGRLVKQDKVRQ